MKKAKKIILIFAAIVVVLLLTLTAIFATAFAGNSETVAGKLPPPLDFVDVVKDSYVTVAILDVGDGKVALIDAGNDKSGAPILAELQARKLDPHAVTAIFLTHGHPDHVAAAMQFPEAKIYALAADIPLAQGLVGGHGLVTRFMPVHPSGVQVTRGLQDGEVVQVGNRSVHVLAIPGHTPGSAAYFVDGALFLGDSAGASSDGKLKPAPRIFTDDPEGNVRSLKELPARLAAAKLEVKELVFAHTGPLMGVAGLEAFGRE